MPSEVARHAGRGDVRPDRRGAVLGLRAPERGAARAPRRRRAAPAELSEATYRRTLRARAFDVARSLLPLATNTSVGQIVSARVLERQIGRLLGSPYAEVRAVGAELKAGLPGASPRRRCRRELAAAGGADARQVRRSVRLRCPAAGTSCDSGRRDAAGDPRCARPICSGRAGRALRPTRCARSSPRCCIGTTRPATASGRSRPGRRPEPGPSRRSLRSVAGGSRHARRPVARAPRLAMPSTFDVLVDLGSFRDLHRHRRCVQVQQPLTWTPCIRATRGRLRSWAWVHGAALARSKAASAKCTSMPC